MEAVQNRCDFLIVGGFSLQEIGLGEVFPSGNSKWRLVVEEDMTKEESEEDEESTEVFGDAGVVGTLAGIEDNGEELVVLAKQDAGP
ncbi:hypothetical protein CVT26_007552 [Gymnopilus dilepis]|uniref:Uncharacterized protein n=1 Tax=Gymnopilus dilepis TaxID=231916 RepID=A0A409WWI2_9AGAR|nr:hypothetical protein CVT26_007552 [Gymnopilus dilepis]